MKKRIASDAFANSCYFRTSVEPPYRKALVQINEDCNLKCAHCFVSAKDEGDRISLDDFQEKILPQLIKAKVISVSLTGGEPMRHPEVDGIISSLHSEGIKVTICTNGTLLSEEQMGAYQKMGNISCNVSLDGFSTESHGRFRGDRGSFQVTKSTIAKLGKHGILKGILVTPNSLATSHEYEEICAFAKLHGARYVLMNPLSSMGRGVRSKSKLEASRLMMKQIADLTARYTALIDVVYIRFPNDKKPLTSCEAGNIIYVFTSGEVTVCPYLVFATGNSTSQHNRGEFIVGNIFKNDDIAARLDHYNYSGLQGGENDTCASCSQNSMCGKGCPAGVIANGGKIGDLDTDTCPIVSPDPAEPFRLQLPILD